MTYSVNSILTVAECDALLAIMNREKSNLLRRKGILLFQRNNYTSTATEVETELLEVNAQLTMLNMIIPTFPEGRAKEDYMEKQSKFEWRKKALTNKKADYNGLELLNKEYELTCIDHRIDLADEYIAALTARKAEL